MAIPIGILGALGFYAQDLLFEHVLYIDDPLGASALHMGAGIVGVLVPAFFAHPDLPPNPKLVYSMVAVPIFWDGKSRPVSCTDCGVLVPRRYWPFGH